ncbi:hypothetical protein [Streptomyces sp. NPDC097619]|uniref:hypothetical protein n=1 Tax=Streptomyces sp. NPDC097619 TaxID=3157228 RepID=UPI00332E591E
MEEKSGRAAAVEWEYVTYAPAGVSCHVCRRGFEPLVPVWRGGVGAAAVYRHAVRCPWAEEL